MIKKILKNRKAFVPLIFTAKQFQILEKRERDESLSGAEKKAFYTSIKKKIDALRILNFEKARIYLSGAEKIIPDRFAKADEILQEYSEKGKKAFISGSFLFSEKYNDIDIFVIRKRCYIERYEGNIHIIELTEKKLSDPVFLSAGKISISNFQIIYRKESRKISLHSLMSNYHEAIIEILTKKEKKDAVRDLIFEYHLSKDIIIDGLGLKTEVERSSTEIIDRYYKEILKKAYSKNYLYNELHEYIKTIDAAAKNVKNNSHLIHYKKTYEDIIYGSKRDTAEAY